MQLSMPMELGAHYRSASQRVRVISESWGEHNLYCAGCNSDRLLRCAPNTKSIDYCCPECGLSYQLKSSASKFARKVPDGAFATMKATIASGQTPNILALHYDLETWSIKNLILIPHFAFTLSCLEQRAALGPSARRAGWCGCNILLSNIPLDARIAMISFGEVQPSKTVRQKYGLLKPLAAMKVSQRGWTLDVLNVIRSLRKQKFSLKELCAHSAELQRLHPNNKHVQEKVRQQLQRLRDLGVLQFVDNKGNYSLVD